MDRFTVALVSFLLLVLATICVVSFWGNSLFSPQDDGNVTAAAIRIALADPGVAEATNNSFDKTCFVTNVSSYGADGRSGIAGSNRTLLKVSLQFSKDWSVGENRGYVVDVTNGTIVGQEQYFRRLSMPPYYESFILPPGSL